MLINEDFWDEHTMEKDEEKTVDSLLIHDDNGTGVTWNFNIKKSVFSSETNMETLTMDIDAVMRVFKSYVNFIRKFPCFNETEFTEIELSFIVDDRYTQFLKDMNKFPDKIFGIPVKKKHYNIKSIFISVEMKIWFDATVDIIYPRDFITMANMLITKVPNDYSATNRIYPVEKPEYIAEMAFFDDEMEYTIDPDNFDDNAFIHIMARDNNISMEDIRDLCYLFLDKQRTDRLKAYINNTGLDAYSAINDVEFHWE